MSQEFLGICFDLGTRKDKKMKSVKSQTIKINDLYINDLESGVYNNIPTFVNFVPPGIIEGNQRSAIYIIDPCNETPDGIVEYFFEFDFLKRYMRLQLDVELMTVLSSSKMVHVGSNNTCCFLISPVGK